MGKYEDIRELSFDEENVRAVREIYETVHFPPSQALFEQVERLMQGAIDIHCHCGPCAVVHRNFTEIEYGIEATKAGMQAIVNKALTAPTARCACLAQMAVNEWARAAGLKAASILGGTNLSYSVGGLNPDAVEASARLGGRFVWTPVHDAAHARRVDTLAGLPSSGGIEVIDEDGNVVPQLRDVFSVIAKYDLVLSLSHHSTRERLSMIDAAREQGVRRISIAHPFNALTKMGLDQMKMAAEKGVYLEHLFANLAPHLWNWQDTIEAIRTIGADHFVLGSDSGRWDIPPPIPMYRIVIGQLLLRGVPESDVVKMCKHNAEKLIWGEP